MGGNESKSSVINETLNEATVSYLDEKAAAASAQATGEQTLKFKTSGNATIEGITIKQSVSAVADTMIKMQHDTSMQTELAAKLTAELESKKDKLPEIASTSEDEVRNTIHNQITQTFENKTSTTNDAIANFKQDITFEATDSSLIKDVEVSQVGKAVSTLSDDITRSVTSLLEIENDSDASGEFEETNVISSAVKSMTDMFGGLFSAPLYIIGAIIIAIIVIGAGLVFLIVFLRKGKSKTHYQQYPQQRQYQQYPQQGQYQQQQQYPQQQYPQQYPQQYQQQQYPQR